MVRWSMRPNRTARASGSTKVARNCEYARSVLSRIARSGYADIAGVGLAPRPACSLGKNAGAPWSVRDADDGMILDTNRINHLSAEESGEHAVDMEAH